MTVRSVTLECRDLDLAYDGRASVVTGFTLEVAAGESVALLGPSGSGKTTILSGIAGFIDPLGGEIRLGGRTVATPGRSLAPEQRRVGVVFQHSALWPHLTAVESVAFPMQRQGVARGRAHADALALLDRLGLADLADRRPAQLSGGEQQRVGLARAIAREPDLFLFDEPTAHLDTPLRVALQEELAERRAHTGTAALTATHDVAEALAAADRVVILREGRLIQVGTPLQVYEQPADTWAARLTGPASVLDAALLNDTVARVEGPVSRTGAGGQEVLVRPDWASFGGELTGRVVSVWFRGPHTDYRLATEHGQVEIREAGPPRVSVGSTTDWRLHRAWRFATE
ncbi:MAG: ABC transporter ATP-binding protein [Chloroflexota bacterium]